MRKINRSAHIHLGLTLDLIASPATEIHERAAAVLARRKLSIWIEIIARSGSIFHRLLLRSHLGSVHNLPIDLVR